jgi:ubiquinone/menaquinone biosynthesis C-methylase UbiE
MKLHLGCGHRNFGSDWVHIDGGDFLHLHSHDILNLPFIDNSASIIYASHVLEYFDRDEVVLVLKEWKRVLRHGGTLRLAVPDMYKIMFICLDKGYSITRFLGPIYGKIKMGDKNIYHKTGYDRESLMYLLEENGFGNVKDWDWRDVDHGKFDDHSQAYFPHMDKQNGTLISLNLECKKI